MSYKGVFLLIFFNFCRYRTCVALEPLLRSLKAHITCKKISGKRTEADHVDWSE